MIHYRLRCERTHEFEGWFASSASFEDQARRGLLSCPECGTTRVDRGLMSPAVRTRPTARIPAAGAAEPVPAENGGAAPGGGVAPAVPPAGAPPTLPDAMRAMLQRMRSEIERTCDNLGDGFAEEAIRMRHGEVAQRGIYGNATEADREVLADEGIEIVQIPWLKRAEG